MSYPFTTFPLVNRVGVTNPYANVDARYGPWNTRNDALTSFATVLRKEGLTLGIVESGKVVEYWYRDGILDSNLVLKTPDINIAGYLPLSGGTISGNLSVLGGFSAQNIFTTNLNVSNSFIRPVSNIGGFNFVVSNSGILYDSLEIRKNELLLKSPSQFLQTDLFFDNSLSSSAIFKAGTDRFLASIALSAIDVGVKSPLSVDNNIKIEGTFNSTKNKPSGNLLFRDLFTEPVTIDLSLHNPNIGFNWIRPFQSIPSATLSVIANQNEISPIFNGPSQGLIYQPNYTILNNSNYEITVFCKEISPIDPVNFNVFWLMGRFQNIQNFYALRVGPRNGDTVLYRKINGVFSTLKTINLSLDSRFNFYVSLRIENNLISVFINDVFIDSVIDNNLTTGLGAIGFGNLGVRGNDGIDIRTRLTEFTITPYTGFEKDSYIDQNRFGVGTKTPNEKLTVSGNISSNNLIYALGGSSQDWNSNFTTVCTLSSQWNQSSNIIPTVTNYLSTNNVTVSSLNVLTNILSGGNNLTNIIYDATKWDYYSLTLAGSAQLPYNKKANSFYRINANQFGLALPPNARLGDVIRIENTNNTNFLSVSAYPTFFTEYPQFVLLGTISPQQSRTYVYGTVSLFKPLFLGGGGGSGGGTSQENTWFEFSTTDAHTSKSITDYDIGSLFSTVQSNSATNWDETTQIIPTVTNYLSTNQVQVSSVISQEGLYDSGYFWKQYQAPNNNNWQSITYGNGLFVAIANSNVVTPNKIMTSSDGINWTLREVPIQNNWVSITYGNGLFVGVADDGSNNQRILTSSDAINWTPVSTISNPWKKVCYGNGFFVAVADPVTLPANSVIISSDGFNWQPFSSTIFKSLAYGNNIFIGVTQTMLLSSINGNFNVFNPVYSNNSEQFTGITYGNGLFLVTSNTGSVYSAKADSTNYSRIVNANPNFTNSKPYYANGLYFIISRDTGVWVSQDTLNWQRPISNLTGTAFRDICYGNGVFVLLANGLANDNNIFVSGKIKNIENNDFNPRYGGLNLYGNLTSNNLVIASSGNSQLWTEVYSRVAANSSTWNAAGSPNVNLSSIFATVCSLSTNWNSVYNTTCALSTNWSSVYSYWNPLTANTRDSVSFVNTNSANILNVNTKVNNTSGNWDSVYSQLCALSSKWNTPYDTALNINSTNAVENSAIAVKIQSLENGLNVLVPQPIYNQPVATLTNFNNVVYEVGETVVQTITLGFTQNDAGSPQLYRLERNNFFIGQQTFPFSYNVNEIVVQGTINFQNTVTYNEGPTKNNLLGLPDTRGKILAGSTSTIRSYTGRFRQFFGSVSSVPTNLRTLTGNNFDDVNTFSFYAHQLNNVLAIPATKSLQSAVTQNNETVTGNFALSSVFVNNANGVPVSYKRYVQTTNVPFNVNITFTLTTP